MGEEHQDKSTPPADGASVVVGGAALEVHSASSLVRGENEPVMVETSNFTTLKILNKRSSSSGVDYECELGPLWLPTEIVEGLQIARVHILSYEKGLTRDVCVGTLRSTKRKAFTNGSVLKGAAFTGLCPAPVPPACPCSYTARRIESIFVSLSELSSPQISFRGFQTTSDEGPDENGQEVKHDKCQHDMEE